MHQAENYIEIVQQPRARADGHIAAEQRNIQTYLDILLLLYLRINICIIFRPVPRAEARPRTGAMSVRRSSERHAHTSQHQHTSHTHHQRSHSARHAR